MCGLPSQHHPSFGAFLLIHRAGTRRSWQCLGSAAGQDAEIAGLLWGEVLRLARELPTEAELKEEMEGFHERYQDPRAVEGELERAACADLFALRYRDGETRLKAMREVTPEEVRDCFAHALTTAQLAVAADVEPRLTALDGTALPQGGCRRHGDLPAGEVFRPPLLARAMYSAARRARLVLTPPA